MIIVSDNDNYEASSDKKITEDIKRAIYKWECENPFLAAVLQKECLNYSHYINEVLLCIEDGK